MTVLTSDNRADYFGNGVQVKFAFSFIVARESHMTVYLDGVLQSEAGYSVGAVGSPTGGSVTFVTPPGVGVVVTLLRFVPYTQEDDYTAADRFPAEVHEQALDLCVMRDQQQVEESLRTLRYPLVGAPAGGSVLPVPAADSVIGYDGAGELTNVAIDAGGGAGLVANPLVANLSAGAYDFLVNGQPLGAKLARLLFVTDVAFAGGAVGDGGSDSQAALVAAVAAAAAAGDHLYWPAGIYVSNASIPLFHTVKHRGPGILRRGTDDFPVYQSSGDTINLYVSPSGDDANDGLSAAQPMRTLPAASTVLGNYARPSLAGLWTVNMAAGNYGGGFDPPRALRSEGFLKLAGPDVGGHPNVPTAKIRVADDPTQDRAVQLLDGTMFEISNVKIEGPFVIGVSALRLCYALFTNVHADGHWASNASPTAWATATAYTIGQSVTESATQYYCIEDHTSGVFADDLAAGKWYAIPARYIRAWSIVNHSRYRAIGGIIEDCQEGISELFGVVRDFPTLVSTLGPGEEPFDYQLMIKDCDTGLNAKENCVGHTDLITFQDCATGMELQLYSGTNPRLAKFVRCQRGIVLANSEIHNEASIRWGEGVDACGVHVLSLYNSAELGFQGWDGDHGVRVGHRPLTTIAETLTAVDHTGTVSETNVFSPGTIMRRGWFAVQGKRMRVEAVLRVLSGGGLAANARFLLRVSGTYMIDVTLPAGMANNAIAKAEWIMVCTSDGDNQLVTSTVVGNGVYGAASARRPAALSDADHSMLVSCILGNAADTVRVESVSVFG